ncbi:4-hydroxy-tetrahydrodipicolinate synthase [bacterium]|nr:4-hydroxy-tetrahydrodipicolinate synthase [bacterium]
MFKGSIVALITPFRKNGSIDHGLVRELVEWHIASGTDAIVPCATTGESPTLSHDEHDEVIATVVKAVNKRIPVLAGCGSNCTEESLRLIKHAESVGADGALVITPYYNKPTQEGMLAHYESLASATKLPIVIYNVPGRTGVNIKPETVAKLAKIENIVGIKEASGSLDQASEIMRSTDLDVLSGEDSLNFPLMAIGAVGVISVVANVVPDLVAKLADAAQNGDMEEGRRLHKLLFPLSKALFAETNPCPVKAAMAMLGKCENVLRLPLVPVRKDTEELIRKALADLGAL